MAKLTINEAAAGFTHKVAFDYVDLQRSGFLSTIGAANQFKAGKLGAGGIIDTAVLYQVVDPAGASNLTIDFGVTAADPDEFIDNGDVDAHDEGHLEHGRCLCWHRLGFRHNLQCCQRLRQ